MPASSPAPLVLPRPLIFFASLWLIGSWLVAIGIRAPIHPVSASYEPGVRLMLVCMATGLLIGWPLFRLSQDAPPWPARQVLVDMISLLALTQVVVWPLRLVTTWTVGRTLAIDLALIGWVLLAGGITAAGLTSSRRGPRHLAMIACLALCLLGPALALVGLILNLDLMRLSGLSAILTMRDFAHGGGAPPTLEEWRLASVLVATGLAGWTALGVTQAARAVGARGAAVRDRPEE